MNALLIDDEALARRELRRLLEPHPIRVVGEAGDVATGMAEAARLRPEVIFLDVQLRGETGFDFLAGYLDPRLRVVLVTAHPGFAVRGFDHNVFDYLLKPVDRCRLSETIRRLARAAVAPRAEQGGDLTLLKTAGAARLVPWQDIVCVVAEGNYTRVTLRDGSSLVVPRTLKEWLALAPSEGYAQVHRAHVVRLDWIREIRADAAGSRSLLLAHGAVLGVGRAYWLEFKTRLDRTASRAIHRVA
ncbi:MAG: response regulator [Burkholderiales bacterium]|nr:response regulator [Opitutaceae bacterium]